MPRLTLLIPLAWTILSANAHFILDFPSGLTDDTEEMATGPCGGQDFSFDGDATELAVNGFPVQVTTSHPEAMWSYRYTTDEEEPLTWTDIVPIVSQQGVGKFCLSSLNVSADLAGQTALMQVIQAGDHGNLYAVRHLDRTPVLDFAFPLLLMLDPVRARQLCRRRRDRRRDLLQRHRCLGNVHRSDESE